jgi:hypothetical protein
VLVRGLRAVREQDDAPDVRHLPHGVAPTPGPTAGSAAVWAAGCGARDSPRASGEGWQLLIELAPSLGELIKTRPTLGVDGAVTWCRLWVGGARSRRHAYNAYRALACGVARPR